MRGRKFSKVTKSYITKNFYFDDSSSTAGGAMIADAYYWAQKEKGNNGYVMVALIEAAFNTSSLKCQWKSRKLRKNTDECLEARSPWWTVSVLSTVVRLPCWSRHCCFLYWPLLWKAFSPSPCYRPGCLVKSAETPAVLGGKGEEGNKVMMETMWVQRRGKHW